jgi:choice-of-anchor C domain-containing protein
LGDEDAHLPEENTLLRRALPITFAALAGSALIASPVYAAAELVTNGGFEAVAVSGAYTANTTTLSGWTVAAGDIDIIGSYWQANVGNQSIDLSGCSAGTIRQQLTTTSGTSYNLSYFVSGNPGDPGDPPPSPTTRSAVLSVGTSSGGSEIGTQPIAFDTAGNTLTSMGWTAKSYTFTASSAATWIEFTDTSSTTCFGVALDDISVQEAVVVSQLSNALAIVAMAAVAGAVVLGGRRLRSQVVA